MAASPPLLRMARQLEHTVEATPKNGLKRRCADRACSLNKRRRISRPPPPPPSYSRVLPSPSQSPSASSTPSSSPATETATTSTPTSTNNGDCNHSSVRHSLSATMKHHNRVRLYVPPIAWTPTHLKLLHLEFKLNHLPDSCDHTRRDNCAPYKREVLRAARQLRCENAEAQQIAMGEILKHYRLQELERNRTNRLELFYEGKKAARVLTDGIFKAESGLGRPVAGLRNKKLKRLKPAVDAEDPYILGVLMALAQKQRQERVRVNVNPSGGDVAEKVYAIAFPFIRARVAYFYKAVIPSSFLEKFEKPYEAIKCDGFVVSYVTIRLDTAEETLSRLIQTLCSHKLLHCAKAQSR
ncbi:hypothetical protein MAC_09831 [Metarhizium acridum CQMa 102]|uniref:Uncharacterized protein n=1 Tax=Metarhizium acridum (strain CQMa 102) TaxID=655827 RepID=E9EIY3_METAQ|nr:uncharacterized protein MAC_09831 [Metarhizium acridum CQMa 102]EFY84124.1 hypothetical protein MAC_09831 [Metarhizium acridum CQMa 102]